MYIYIFIYTHKDWWQRRCGVRRRLCIHMKAWMGAASPCSGSSVRCQTIGSRDVVVSCKDCASICVHGWTLPMNVLAQGMNRNDI